MKKTRVQIAKWILCIPLIMQTALLPVVCANTQSEQPPVTKTVAFEEVEVEKDNESFANPEEVESTHSNKVQHIEVDLDDSNETKLKDTLVADETDTSSTIDLQEQDRQDLEDVEPIITTQRAPLCLSSPMKLNGPTQEETGNTTGVVQENDDDKDTEEDPEEDNTETEDGASTKNEGTQITTPEEDTSSDAENKTSETEEEQEDMEDSSEKSEEEVVVEEKDDDIEQLNPEEKMMRYNQDGWGGPPQPQDWVRFEYWYPGAEVFPVGSEETPGGSRYDIALIIDGSTKIVTIYNNYGQPNIPVLGVGRFHTHMNNYFKQYLDSSPGWSINIDNGDIRVSNTQNLFNFCDGGSYFFAHNNLNSIITDGHINMARMFQGNKGLGTFSPNFNTSSVTDMSEMFRGVEQATIYTPNWDFSQVQTMRQMFYHAYKVETGDLTWNTEALTNMEGMFHHATDSEFNINLNTSKVTNMSSLFRASRNNTVTLEDWDVSNVTTLANAFSATKDINYNVHRWNPEKLADARGIFKNAYYDELDISGWGNLPSDAVTDFHTFTSFYIPELGAKNQTTKATLGQWLTMGSQFEVITEGENGTIHGIFPIENNDPGKFDYDRTKENAVKLLYPSYTEKHKHTITGQTVINAFNEIKAEKGEGSENLVYMIAPLQEVSFKNEFNVTINNDERVLMGSSVDINKLFKKEDPYKNVYFYKEIDTSKLGKQSGVIRFTLEDGSVADFDVEVTVYAPEFPCTGSSDLLLIQLLGLGCLFTTGFYYNKHRFE